MVRALKLFGVAAAALVLLTSCGNAGDDNTGAVSDESTASATRTTATPSDPPLPACDDVWMQGTALSEEYLGCREGGKKVAVSLRCETGQELFTYAGRMFAIPGGRIFEASGALADDARYQRIYRACTA